MGRTKGRKKFWREKWIIGGDFNYITEHDEKKEGRRRVENSFDDFRRFIPEMEMEDIKFEEHILWLTTEKVRVSFKRDWTGFLDLLSGCFNMIL